MTIAKHDIETAATKIDLAKENEALKAEASKQDEYIAELIEAIEDCGVDVDEILEAKKG